MINREEIVQLLNMTGISADNLDWERCRACFAENVTVDYSSFFPGEVEMMKSSVLMERWRGVLSGFDSTQHVIGSHIVKDNDIEVTCQANFIATHILDDKMWQLGGTYFVTLIKECDNWKINKLTMKYKWTQGNYEMLIQEAMKRASDQREKKG